MVTITLVLEPALWARVLDLARAQGWSPEDAVLILLGYGAAAHADGHEHGAADALGAARAELALLRHRVFEAREAVRDLQMNVTGLTASIAQAEKSLALLEPLVGRLRTPGGRASAAQEEPSARERLFAFLARHHQDPPASRK
ncbi:MAG: hypothetical protein QN173_05930 [Armatimonadota bacterium]|nr:hypothetical protein [Armatimonadota bacterium]MDR7402818.1 hypothetical protein [Armatimonadota bacterium]MDR7403955.1 hypothetical protein [Armatimonadota bacterium]MDR7436156.1 hypothetical protein [Armatimonadota bacterium]MDR7472035.1 hypothetical protein [Armatimonadota bacterium]